MSIALPAFIAGLLVGAGLAIGIMLLLARMVPIRDEYEAEFPEGRGR